MIDTVKVRELDLVEPIQIGRSAFLSAASGLVRVGQYLYVIADDENHLAVFQNDSSHPGTVLRLFDGDLPTDDTRKKFKPDLEAITFLPVCVGAPHGALLCIPSGSKDQRRTGAIIPLDATGATDGIPRLINLAMAFDFLTKHCGPLNIEAVAAFDTNIYFLNRGNKKHRGNALIGLSLQAFFKSINSGLAPTDSDLIVHTSLDLGELAGVPLTPTDAVITTSGQMVFTAAAEETESSYDDGTCLGSAIGILDLTGKLLFLDAVDTKKKLEGVDARVDGNRLTLLLVNDEDSHASPSELCRAHLAI